MRCLVVGAGSQGAAAAAILARDADVTGFTLADYDEELVAKVKAKLMADGAAADKIQLAHVDARDIDAVTKLARECEVILNFVHMDYSKSIRAAALAAGVHYVDTASDLQWQHDIAFKHQVNDDDAFRKAGLCGVACSGDTPGVANAMARYAADILDEIDELMIRLGMRFASGDPNVVFHPFDPGWCPDVALQDFNDKACVFTGGKPTMQGPFANPEVYRFPEPVGEVLICSHSHDESYTLPFFIGKGLKECDFKYAVDEQAGTLVAMGFGDPEKVIELRDGTKVRPFEVAMALTPQAKEGFFAETKEGLANFPDWDASMVIEANGRKDGKAKRVRVHRAYTVNQKTRGDLLASLGTTNPLVAAPAIAAAKLIARGEVKPGVMAVEALDPLAYLKAVAAIMPLDIDVSVTTGLPA